VPVFGLYVNGVVALSTNSVEVEDKVLLNGIKYVPDVLSLVNAIDDEEVELPLKLPENVVAVIELHKREPDEDPEILFELIIF
jgi:hypothetical protein